MTPMERASLLLALDEELLAAGSWAGETHMQKASFCAQELLRVPLELEFVIYKHGPYSFELADELTAMRAEEFLEVVPKPYPYGPSLLPGRREQLLAKAYEPLVNAHRRAFKFIASQFGQKNVAELERITTLLYIRNQPEWTAEDPAQKLVELKPHVKPEDALQSLAELRRIVQAAKAQFPDVHIASAGRA